MTDNKMTPEQFVKEWLRDFNRKWRNHLIEIAPYVKRRWGKHTPKFKDFPGTAQNFIKEHFPEALEAFARHVWDQACREQREECAMSVAGESDHTGMRFVAETDDDLRLHIINALSAPAPEFKLTENPETKNEER